MQRLLPDAERMVGGELEDEARKVLGKPLMTEQQKMIQSLEILKIGYEARIELLETALAGLCGALGLHNENELLNVCSVDWSRLGKAWKMARDVLDPS